MNAVRLALATVAALPVLACGSAQKTETSATAAAAAPADEPFKRIEAAKVADKLKAAPQIFVFDNNSPERYAKGHVPGAQRVAKDAVTADVLPPNKESMLVFYCGGPKCMACHDAARSAIGLGYTNVWIMPDGIKGWEEQGLPTETVAAK